MLTVWDGGPEVNVPEIVHDDAVVELATVVIDRGTLYTFAVGTNEDRWSKVDGMFNNVIESFNFLI